MGVASNIYILLLLKCQESIIQSATVPITSWNPKSSQSIPESELISFLLKNNKPELLSLINAEKDINKSEIDNTRKRILEKIFPDPDKNENLQDFIKEKDLILPTFNKEPYLKDELVKYKTNGLLSTKTNVDKLKNFPKPFTLENTKLKDPNKSTVELDSGYIQGNNLNEGILNYNVLEPKINVADIRSTQDDNFLTSFNKESELIKDLVKFKNSEFSTTKIDMIPKFENTLQSLSHENNNVQDLLGQDLKLPSKKEKDVKSENILGTFIQNDEMIQEVFQHDICDLTPSLDPKMSISPIVDTFKQGNMLLISQPDDISSSSLTDEVFSQATISGTKFPLNIMPITSSTTGLTTQPCLQAEQYFKVNPELSDELLSQDSSLLIKNNMLLAEKSVLNSSAGARPLYTLATGNFRSNNNIKHNTDTCNRKIQVDISMIAPDNKVCENKALKEINPFEPLPNWETTQKRVNDAYEANKEIINSIIPPASLLKDNFAKTLPMKNIDIDTNSNTLPNEGNTCVTNNIEHYFTPYITKGLVPNNKVNKITLSQEITNVPNITSSEKIESMQIAPKNNVNENVFISPYTNNPLLKTVDMSYSQPLIVSNSVAKAPCPTSNFPGQQELKYPLNQPNYQPNYSLISPNENELSIITTNNPDTSILTKHFRKPITSRNNNMAIAQQLKNNLNSQDTAVNRQYQFISNGIPTNSHFPDSPEFIAQPTVEIYPLSQPINSLKNTFYVTEDDPRHFTSYAATKGSVTDIGKHQTTLPKEITNISDFVIPSEQLAYQVLFPPVNDLNKNMPISPLKNNLRQESVYKTYNMQPLAVPNSLPKTSCLTPDVLDQEKSKLSSINQLNSPLTSNTLSELPRAHAISNGRFLMPSLVKENNLQGSADTNQPQAVSVDAANAAHLPLSPECDTQPRIEALTVPKSTDSPMSTNNLNVPIVLSSPLTIPSNYVYKSVGDYCTNYLGDSLNNLVPVLTSNIISTLLEISPKKPVNISPPFLINSRQQPLTVYSPTEKKSKGYSSPAIPLTVNPNNTDNSETRCLNIVPIKPERTINLPVLECNSLWTIYPEVSSFKPVTNKIDLRAPAILKPQVKPSNLQSQISAINSYPKTCVNSVSPSSIQPRNTIQQVYCEKNPISSTLSKLVDFDTLSVINPRISDYIETSITPTKSFSDLSTSSIESVTLSPNLESPCIDPLLNVKAIDTNAGESSMESSFPYIASITINVIPPKNPKSHIIVLI